MQSFKHAPWLYLFGFIIGIIFLIVGLAIGQVAGLILKGVGLFSSVVNGALLISHFYKKSKK